jgi:phosphoglycerate dehydrogenase-like enzyme
VTYRIGITDDAIAADGTSVHGDLRLRELVEAGIAWEVISAHPESDDDLAGLDAVYALGHRRFDAGVLACAPRLRHVARFGAGYDTIDVADCTAAGVAVTTTPAAVRRPMALAGLTLVLAVTHNLVQKHRLTVESRWQDRETWRGRHTQAGRVAVVGFGGIGAELAELLLNVGFDVVGVNRSGRSGAADRLGIPLIGLDEALGADVVVLCAALTDETRGMIGERELGLMRPDAALVNIGRGGLVDQDALVRALIADDGIRAAGLDVFDPEPPSPDDPLLTLPNVTMAPHSLAWTDAFTRAVASSANEAIIAVSRGERPAAALNPAAFEHPRWGTGGA